MAWPYLDRDGSEIGDNLALLYQRTGSFSTLRTDADRLAFQRAVQEDISSLVVQLNTVYKKLVSTLSQESDLDALDWGLSGNVIFSHLDSESVSGEIFWDDINERGKTIKESLDYIASKFAAIEASLASISATSRNKLWFNRDIPAAPNQIIEYHGWVPTDSTLIAIRTSMQVVNTQGNYTLSVQNVETSEELINSGPFDMNTLIADTITQMTLDNSATLVFSSTERWLITLESDDAGFDGEGIYVELVFEEN